MSKAAPSQLSNLEKNKQIIRNFIEDTLNRHDVVAADRYFAENPRQFKQFLSGFFQRFPDSHTTIDHILAEELTSILSDIKYENIIKKPLKREYFISKINSVFDTSTGHLIA